MSNYDCMQEALIACHCSGTDATDCPMHCEHCDDGDLCAEHMDDLRCAVIDCPNPPSLIEEESGSYYTFCNRHAMEESLSDSEHHWTSWSQIRDEDEDAGTVASCLNAAVKHWESRARGTQKQGRRVPWERPEVIEYFKNKDLAPAQWEFESSDGTTRTVSNLDVIRHLSTLGQKQVELAFLGLNILHRLGDDLNEYLKVLAEEML